MGKELKNHLYNQDQPVELIIEYGEFAPGTQLWGEILEKITSSDISIFDISENNPNVLLEVGISFGSDKQVILLKNKETNKRYPTPSDLSAFVYIPYDSPDELYQHIVIGKIIKSISYFLNNRDPHYFYYHLLWGLALNSKTIIVPSKLPTTNEPTEFEDYIYIRKYGDLDALFLVEQTLLRLYPKMEIEISPAEKLTSLPNGWEDSNLIIIGGPDFNPIGKFFEHLCSFEYCYGSGKNDVWLRHKMTEKEYIPKIFDTDKDFLADDYGFFLKRKNSKNGGCKLIMIGGAHTWGVYGAAMLFSCNSLQSSTGGYKNSKLMVTKFGSDPSFIVNFKVRGNKDGILPFVLDLKKVEILE
ncbi:MAG: hypothetical protein DIAAKJNI_00384 [Candidatus Argoarchaeum ethanivorans]|uniref:S-layer protein C-terminal domain-containing protein n=1 Tax=Candidatus Argoarchaeum ethanivorans TaxID=2608793 RepID=A0A811TAM4_9EURY|nr:MAG: hypothetical protein DIAAKJNI_00384 [Candidatus Argoarchaeum ethanivorans]